MTKHQGVFWAGTSNIVIPGNRKSFPPEYQNKSRLHYYSSIFNSVEINSSFYKTPLPSTFQRWASDVKNDFRFSVKLSRDITHVKNLKFQTDDLLKFLHAADQLELRKGCLLIQFPGKITVDSFSEVEELLDRVDGRWRMAVEFRHTSWYIGETNDLLSGHGATMVIHDIPKSRNDSPFSKADFIYLRFHGEKGDYRGSYSNDRLQAAAANIKSWLNKGNDVYAYFNNTIGDAFNDVNRLKQLVVNE